jgi:hypothetical protein
MEDISILKQILMVLSAPYFLIQAIFGFLVIGILLSAAAKKH